MIREIIVVEGKDDITAVKQAVEAEVLATGGYAYGKKFLQVLKKAQERRGVIIFTDPDYMGEKIRRDLTEVLPGAKQAFLPRGKALKGDNVGVENATAADIRKALENAKAVVTDGEALFTMEDLRVNNLVGADGATKRREELGILLGIGHGNAKQFLKRLNALGITREEFRKGCEQVGRP